MIGPILIFVGHVLRGLISLTKSVGKLGLLIPYGILYCIFYAVGFLLYSFYRGIVQKPVDLLEKNEEENPPIAPPVDDPRKRAPTGLPQPSQSALRSPSLTSTPTLNTISSSQMSRFGKRQIKPEKYTGDKGEDLGDYLSYFTTVGISNEWTEEEYALNLSVNLTGTARQAWVDANGPGANKLSYDELVDALVERFQPRGQEKAYRAEFRLRTKEKHESYIEYGSALRRLARKAFPRSSSDDQEEHAIEQFLSGLSTDMKVHVSMHITSASLSDYEVGMNEVIRLAYDYELSTTKGKAVASKPTVNVGMVTCDNEESDDDDDDDD